MLGDTIVALATAPGQSVRAVLRLSGPCARAAAALVFVPELPARRAIVEGHVLMRGALVETMALVMVAPASFTGEDVVELHLPGSPLLVRLLQEDMLARGTALGLRAALPGEFTARAHQNGRLDGTQVEGLLLLLHAEDQRAAAAAVQWLRGGFATAIGELRAGLQDVLALLEAGLDFTEGETGTVAEVEWLPQLLTIEQGLVRLLAEVPAAAPGGEVLLLGAANAGKSSLCNALAGRSAALVDGTPGTTRDLLRIEIAPGVALWDAPGDLEDPAAVDKAALALRDRLAGRAGAAICVLDATAPKVPPAVLRGGPPLLAVVWSKCDLIEAPPALPIALQARLAATVPVLATSSVMRTGLEPLRELLVRGAHRGSVDAGGPLREALQRAAAAVARGREVAALGAEVAAAELQAALRAIDDLGERHSPERLLDRIYGRFCLGK